MSYAEEVATLDGIDITDDVLNKKFCDAKILGGVSISGALLDTTWIVPKTTGIQLFHMVMIIHFIFQPYQNWLAQR